jgi:hypothetical protein
VAKDRAAPFSRKHRRYWIPVLGGMILIGLINLVIGYVSYSTAPEVHEKIQLTIPPPSVNVDASVPADVKR